MTRVTKPAWGIPAAPKWNFKNIKLKDSAINWYYSPMLAAVAVILTAIIFVNDKFIPLNWAIKIAATASYLSYQGILEKWIKVIKNISYRAVPSIFIVAPMGNTNFETLSSTWLFFSKHSIVTGSVAELDEVPKAFLE